MYVRLFRKHVLRSKKRLVRYSLLTANIVLLLVVIAFVSDTPAPGSQVGQSALSRVADTTDAVANPLDQLSSADIAVHVAKMTRLDETVAVINHADSVNAQLTAAPAENSLVSKPQIVATDTKSKKDIINYVAKEGENIPALATKFGVTSDSIRWSNGITGDALRAGQELVIPPTNGIVYTVKTGDTADSLAQKYSSNKQKLIEMNDAEVAGIKVGERIILPDAVQPVERVALPLTTPAASFGAGGMTANYGGNGYDYGWCTWHVANRRIQIGRPLPTNLGNAISWYYLAQRAGLPVGTQPQAGAVIWHANLGGLGHVGFVEKINEDGSMLVSDMNYPTWGRATFRTVPPGEFGNYRFIY